MNARNKLQTLALTTTALWLGQPLLTTGWAQDSAKPAGAESATQSGSIGAIDELYRKELGEVERRRLERLAALAGKQSSGEANKTYELYFQSAIAANLFAESEPLADRVLRSKEASSKVVLLADIAKIMAQVGRGAYEEALASLTSMLAESARAGAAADGALPHALPVSARLTILEACFQRLSQAGQFGVARKAFRLVFERTTDPTVKAFAEARLARLEMVGKPAPPIAGTDIDGQPVRSSDFRGDVVLVVFWTTWCPNCGDEVASLEAVHAAYRDRGFRILGVNLDTLNGGKSADLVQPAVREFLLENNVAWPNLISGRGEQDYARAYAVSEVPANVLIGRDGTVIELDLTHSNLEKAVARAVAR